MIIVTDSYDVRLDQAKMALQEGDSKAAAVHLGKILTYPGMLTTSASWTESLNLMARLWSEGADAQPRLTDLAQQASATPENPKVLYQLGTELIEQGHPAYGATILAGAYRLDPKDDRILPEWVAALEMTRHYGEAVRLLKAADQTQAGEFLFNYLLAFNSLMTGDLESPRQLAPRLRQRAKDATEVHMAWRLTGMVARANTIASVSPLDASDQRGWHFVLTAGILLNPVPTTSTVARHEDTPATILGGIRRLQAVLSAWKINPTAVIEVPSRNNGILAHATAAVLNLPLRAWVPNGNNYSHAVVPIYDLERVDGTLHADLKNHHSHSVLWAHHANWTREHPFAADITTLLHKGASPFWEARMVANPDTFELDIREADERSVNKIAAEIVATTLPGTTLDDLDTLTTFATTAATLEGEHGPAALRPTGHRLRQWAGLPALCD
jgi:hypothetical protein